MSVIAAKRYKDKIVIGLDQQISFWRDKEKKRWKKFITPFTCND